MLALAPLARAPGLFMRLLPSGPRPTASARALSPEGARPGA